MTAVAHGNHWRVTASGRFETFVSERSTPFLDVGLDVNPSITCGTHEGRLQWTSRYLRKDARYFDRLFTGTIAFSQYG